MSPFPNQAHTSQISTDPDLWHKRLEHPSPACLQLASSLLPINKNLILHLIYCIVTFGVLIKLQLILENVFFSL